MNKFIRRSLFLVLIFLGILEYFLLIPIGFYTSSIIYFGIATIIIVSIIKTYGKKISKGGAKDFSALPILLSFALVVIILGGTLVFSPIFNGKKYRDILPQPKVTDLEKELKAYDEGKTGIIPQDEAEKIMSTQVSQKGNMGSIAQIGEATKQEIKDELWYVAPLEYKGFFSWLNNKSKGTGFIMVNANTKECKVIDKNLKIQPGSYFNLDLERALFLNAPTKKYGDYTFELDDDLNPYYTVTTYKAAVGFKGEKVSGLALVNAVTGEIKHYGVEDAPKWVDRIQPMDYVEKAINFKGKYINGFSPLNDNDKFKTTEGTGVVYNNGKCYYYTGITSLGKDESSLGFYLVDSRTGETFLYKKSGAIEEVAISTAENKVKNLGYKGSFPLLVSIENKLTYFIPLLGSNNLTMSYAFVNVNDLSIVAVAPTVDQAKDEYIKYLYNKNMVSSENGKTLTKEGIIARVNSFVQQGSSYYIFTIEGEDKNFIASIEVLRTIALLKNGDKVNVEYIDNGTNEVIVKNIKILNKLN